MGGNIVVMTMGFLSFSDTALRFMVTEILLSLEILEAKMTFSQVVRGGVFLCQSGERLTKLRN